MTLLTQRSHGCLATADPQNVQGLFINQKAWQAASESYKTLQWERKAGQDPTFSTPRVVAEMQVVSTPTLK